MQVPRDASSFFVLRPQKLAGKTPELLICPLAFGDVSGNTASCVNISVSIKQREFVDDTCMRSVLQEGYLLKFHGKACAKHLKIIRSIFSGLFRGIDLAIRFAFDLLLTYTKNSLDFSVHQEVATFRILQEDPIGAVLQDRANALLSLPQFLLGPLPVLNIGVRAVPPYDASFRIAQGYTTCQEPAVRPVGSPVAFFLFIRRSIYH